MADDKTGWKDYLEAASPSIALLQGQGLTKGEAVMTLELNALSQVLQKMSIILETQTTAIERQTEILETVVERRDDDGDGWKRGRD